MRLLLDTHSFLWFIAGHQNLSERARNIILDSDNNVLLSIASLWEITIKYGLKKLTLAEPFDVLIPEQITRNEFEILPIELSHLGELLKLEPHHRDPFDRMLIAQAIIENLTVITNDSAFKKYPVITDW